jgi:hypothetical protein
MIRALAPTLVSAFALVVSVLTFRVAQWQASAAMEQQRQNLYDRRFAIYMAFHELLVAITEKPDVGEELRKANAARAHSPFILDATLAAYLQELHTATFKLNASKQNTLNPYWNSLSPADKAEQASQIGPDVLNFSNRIDELFEKFQPFLSLKDSKRDNFP